MASSQIPSSKSSPLRLLWELMRGFRGTYAWAIAALFAFTAINYVTPLVASATIDFALSEEPDSGSLTAGVIAMMGGSEFVQERLWFPAFLMVVLTAVAAAPAP